MALQLPAALRAVMEAPPTLSPDHGLYAGAGSPNISQPEGTGRPQAIARPSHAHSSRLWLLSFGPVASPWPEVWQEGAGRGPRGCSCFCKGADLDLIQRHPLPLPQVAGLGSPPHHPSFTGSIHLGLACKCISPVGTPHGVTPALLPQTRGYYVISYGPCVEGQKSFSTALETRFNPANTVLRKYFWNGIVLEMECSGATDNSSQAMGAQVKQS